MLARLLPVLIFAATFADAQTVNFDRDVRPILADRCFTCHGPDEKRRMANLRLDTKDGLYGVVANHKLLTRISASNLATRMPPAQTGAGLTDAQIEILRRWMEQGAKWERHWAFDPPQRPELPAVHDQKWPRNEIDRFVLARLDREGLKPSPEADRATLLRRLSFDLTGLPPATRELNAFLADKSPDAYEKQVDRLLASPHYGERMALQWLDLSRYADTHGYLIDSQRDMWKWRDWVIDAFNRNMPYDRFGIEQLAGDLLPDATVSQRLATAFNRNHMINFEAGAIPEEYQVEYVADRVDTTATVFMGLTLGCARCHDHKYDPISQKDYYRFFAFFNTIAEEGLDGDFGNAAPILELPTTKQAAQVAWLKRTIEVYEKELPEEQQALLESAWEKNHPALPEPPRAGLLANYQFNGNLADSSENHRDGRATAGAVNFIEGQPDRSAAFNGEAHVEFPEFAAQKFAVAFWMRSGAMLEMSVLEGGPGFTIGIEKSHPQPDFKRGSPLVVEYRGHKWRGRKIVFGGEWQHVAINFDENRPELFLNGQAVAFDLVGPAAAKPAGPVSIDRFKGDLGGLRFYSRELTQTDVDALAIHEPIRFILAREAAKRSDDQKDQLLDYFLTCAAPEDLRRIYAELTKLNAQLDKLNDQIATVQVMSEMATPRETFVLARGDYRNPREKVTPGVPSFLPPLAATAPANRLGLAEWLFSAQHPLTARVAVNRYWQMFFGTGLVKTVEDFGSQGDAPVERELLDWLATEFQKNWDVKALQRLIVTSATYRQSSKVSADLLEKDPENRLLARGPRFRLDAEAVRDNALAVSGLLNQTIGGPSVFPYQPAGLWEELARGETYTAQEYHQSQGADLYRRSLYTFWKRTSPAPSLAAFDAPDREKCTARRLITNTPLQALVLLNDPTYVEAARVLAQRALAEAPDDDKTRTQWMFREATARRPTIEETNLLLDLLHRRMEHYRANPREAAKLIASGASKPAKIDAAELAAWTTVASTILNLDETMTKE
jgi:Protein of unknown function (DUF1553)/Protein of unknown function (DUF1549)/Concanavalin A-like lectin/glucanases superfamily/Planctomycete cytochrome C